MSAWTNAAGNLPETHDDGFENVSRIVLIRMRNGGEPYTARLVGADVEWDMPARWRLLGQDGYIAELDEVTEWCEVPA